MNFATLQGLTIPEGVVTQIADASGRVLWSADNGMRTVTFTFDSYDDEYVSIYLYGNGYNYYYISSDTTLEVPIGTELILSVWVDYEGTDCYIKINGTNVYQKGSAGAEGTLPHVHTVTKDAYVYVEVRNYAGQIELTEQ